MGVYKGTTIMARHRQRSCRICHKNPVWTRGDVTDAQGACKRCYHTHVWAGRPQPRGERTGVEVDGRDRAALWEGDMEAPGHSVRPEELG